MTFEERIQTLRASKRVEQVSRFISSIYIVKKNGWIWVWSNVHDKRENL